jgi:tetratricopeptide (TPR) repeat protein
MAGRLMDVDNNGVQIELRAIKRWIAVGSVGFLLIGGAALAFSISIVSLMHTMGDEISKTGVDDSEEFPDQATTLFEQGKTDELMNLVEERLKEYPNDADAYWYRAKAHLLRQNWPNALADLHQTAFLAPNWKHEYTDPLIEEVKRRMGSE